MSSRVRRVAVILGILLAVSASAATTHPTTSQKDTKQQLIQKALKCLDKQDTFAAIEGVASYQDTLTGASVFDDLMGKLYWDQKNLNAAVAMGRAGVQMALTEALRIHSKQPKLSNKLRNIAWSTSYNVASFTWPGWSEPGILVTNTDISIGLDAARTNLRLTRELKKGALEVSRANWIIGAQQLASGKKSDAIASFQSGAAAAVKARSRADELLNTGFAQMVELLGSPENTQMKARLTATKQALSREKDGADFVQQIDTAYRVFANIAVK